MTRLGDVQRNETRRETRSMLLTVLLWLVTAVIVVAMLLRMLPNNLDGKRYVPLVVADAVAGFAFRCDCGVCSDDSPYRQTKGVGCIERGMRCHTGRLALGVYCAGCQPCRTAHGNGSCYDVQHEAGCCRCAANR